MKLAMRKDFFREIKKSMNRFLSILFIVALGVAFFSGIRASSPDMKLSADQYYDRENMMDFRIVGTWGLTEEDLAGLAKIQGIKEIEPIYSYDVMGRVEQNQYPLKVYSKPEEINKMSVLEGRMPEKEGECVIDSLLLSNEEFQIGKTITISSGTDETLEDVFKNTEYKIVGVVSSPLYMDVERGSTSLGDGKLSGYIAITEDNFALDVYTEAYITVEGAKETTAYSKEYDACVEPVKEKVEEFLKGREELRYDDTIKTAKKEIQDGEKEVKDGENELQDGKQQLSESKDQIQEAKEQLVSGEEEIQTGENQLIEAKNQIEEGESELISAKAQLNESKIQLEDGKKQLESAKSQIAAGEAELTAAKEQVKTGQQQIKVAKQQLKEGEAEYQKNKKEVEAQLSEAKEQLDTAKSVLEQQEVEYAKQEEGALTPITQAKEELQEAKEQLNQLQEQIKALEQTDPNSQQLVQLKQTYETNQKEYQAKKIEVEKKEQEVTTQLNSAKSELTKARTQYETGVKEYETNKKTANTQLKQVKKQLEDGEKEIAEKEALLKESQKTIKKEEAKLALAKEELSKKELEWNKGKEEFDLASTLLASKEQEVIAAKATIEEKEGELEQGKLELEKGKKEVSDGENEIQKAEKEIKDGEAALQEAKEKLAHAKEDLANLEEPEYYALDRGTIISAVSYENDADRIKAIGQVFPVIFFLVAALVSLTTMTRMVESDRTQIGTLKALGYGKASIAMRYLCYALLATLLGSMIGVVVGQTVFPRVIISAYRMMYHTLPDIVCPIHMYYTITSTAVALITILGATFFACMKELQEAPSELMRPVAPKVGKRVLLERIPFFWNRLGFTGKVTIRNLFRYKKRFFMTIFGIGGCMALIIVAFGLQDSIDSIAEKQYGEIIHYDMSVSIKEGKKPEVVLQGQSNVKESLNTYQTTVEVGKSGDTKTYDAYFVVPEEKEKIQNYISLHNRVTKETYDLSSNGVIISEKLHKLLDLEIGDTITIAGDDKENKEVVVEGISENYINHYVYISKELYNSLYDEVPDWNQILVTVNDTEETKVTQLSEQLLKKSGVNSVIDTDEIRNSTSRMTEGMEVVIIVLIVSAGALAFVVLYNLNNINMSERKRELATIKVLGFYDLETAEYVYRENIILTMIGILLGAVLGFFLHQYVIVTAELDMMMMGREVRLASYIYAALLTIGFAMFVNFVLYFKLKKIDMVESLKSVE